MQRRDFVTSVLVGGLVTPVMGDGHTAENDQQGEQGEHEHGKRNDKGTNYTISFGHWNPTPTNTPTQTVSPIDRFAPADPNPRFLNGHDILPGNFKIRVGDTVSFAISGFHLVLIYRGIKAEDVDRTNLLISPPMTFPPLLNDPTNRLYWVWIPGRCPRIRTASRWWDSTHLGVTSSRVAFFPTSSMLPPETS